MKSFAQWDYETAELSRELSGLERGKATVIDDFAVLRNHDGSFHVEGKKTNLAHNQAVDFFMKRRKKTEFEQRTKRAKNPRSVNERVKLDWGRFVSGNVKEAGFVTPDGVLLGHVGRHREVPASLGYGTAESRKVGPVEKFMGDYAVARIWRAYKEGDAQAATVPTDAQIDVFIEVASGKEKLVLEAIDPRTAETIDSTELFNDEISRDAIRQFFERAFRAKGRAKRYAKNPRAYPNLEKSGFHRGEYVAYGGGRVFRVKKESGGWVAADPKREHVFHEQTLGAISSAIERLSESPRAKNPRPLDPGVIASNRVKDLAMARRTAQAWSQLVGTPIFVMQYGDEPQPYYVTDDPDLHSGLAEAREVYLHGALADFEDITATLPARRAKALRKRSRNPASKVFWFQVPFSSDKAHGPYSSENAAAKAAKAFSDKNDVPAMVYGGTKSEFVSRARK